MSESMKEAPPVCSESASVPTTAAAHAQPATALPWVWNSVDGDCSVTTVDGSFLFEASGETDGQYIVHAANAYPKLVEALAGLLSSQRDYERLKGTSVGDVVHDARDAFIDATSEADFLLRALRALGELK